MRPKIIKGGNKMNALIQTQENENGNLLVSGRELHEFLEIGTQYTKWFDRMKEYDFIENVDYVAISQKRLTVQGNETIYNNHNIKIEMAKEISMLQRNEKGKQARRYFLELEMKWNSPEMVMKRAMDYLNKRLDNMKTENLVLTQQVHELKPKADYVDHILKSKSLMAITQISKDYGMSGQKLNKLLHDLKIQYKQGNQWLLYSKHHDKGYTHSETINFIRKDGTADVTLNTKWSVKGRLFLYETLKRENILPSIERVEAS